MSLLQEQPDNVRTWTKNRKTVQLKTEKFTITNTTVTILYYTASHRLKNTYLKSVISLSSWTGVKALLCFRSPSSVAVSGLFVYIWPVEIFH